MSTVRMKRLTAIVNSLDADSVTKELLEQSVLHFVKVKELHGDLDGKIETVHPPISEERAEDLRRRTESLLSVIDYYPGIHEDLSLDAFKPMKMEEASGDLRKITDALDGTRDKQKSIEQEIMRLEDIGRQVNNTGNFQGSLIPTQKSSFLSMRTGTISATQMEKFTNLLKPFPSVHLVLKTEASQITLLLVTMKRDQDRAVAICDQCGFSEINLPLEMDELHGDVSGTLTKKIGALKNEQEKIAWEARDTVKNNKDKLIDLWRNLRIQELYGRVQSYYSKTSRTTLFSGWVPAKLMGKVDQGIHKASQGKCYIEWADPRDEDREKIPVKFSNPKFLKPFQKLVVNYAVPEYGTVDPTPIVAIAYLLMFGLMFGDVGHGFVVFVVGLIGVLLGRKKRKANPVVLGESGEVKGIPGLFPLITYCGISAMIMGVLFGSYFGMGWFKPLWFNYHGLITGHELPTHGFVKDVYSILLITVYFGIAVIGVGLILNWINCVVRREWMKLVLHKTGILGGFIYGSGVYAAYYFIAHDYKQLPPGRFIIIFLLIPTVIFMLKPPIDFLMERKRGHGKRFKVMTIVDFIMEWIVEMLEIFSGYLANTLSFMRVAGLGIAHVSLLIAFFQIADMASSAGHYTVFSYIILLIGNVLVIGLEGLSAGIQSLRLNYYEFFSKYFSGKGELYTPISIKRAKQGTA